MMRENAKGIERDRYEEELKASTKDDIIKKTMERKVPWSRYKEG